MRIFNCFRTQEGLDATYRRWRLDLSWICFEGLALRYTFWPRSGQTLLVSSMLARQPDSARAECPSVRRARSVSRTRPKWLGGSSVVSCSSRPSYTRTRGRRPSRSFPAVCRCCRLAKAGSDETLGTTPVDGSSPNSPPKSLASPRRNPARDASWLIRHSATIAVTFHLFVFARDGFEVSGELRSRVRGRSSVRLDTIPNYSRFAIMVRTSGPYSLPSCPSS